MSRTRKALAGHRNQRERGALRSELLALAGRVGTSEAARQLRIHPRTAQRWVRDAAGSGEARGAATDAARIRSAAGAVREEALASVVSDLRRLVNGAVAAALEGDYPSEELAKLVRATSEATRVLGELDLATQVLVSTPEPSEPEGESEPEPPKAAPGEDDWH
jgi:hypothetical protein